jgi:hypothetical protein
MSAGVRSLKQCLRLGGAWHVGCQAKVHWDLTALAALCCIHMPSSRCRTVCLSPDLQVGTGFCVITCSCVLVAAARALLHAAGLQTNLGLIGIYTGYLPRLQVNQCGSVPLFFSYGTVIE